MRFDWILAKDSWLSLGSAVRGALIAGAFIGVNASAAVLLDESQLVATSAEFAAAAPAAQTLTIATAGQYTVTLTDLNSPSQFTSVGVAITQGSALIAKIDAAKQDQPASVDFDAQPGSYAVQLLGTPAAQSAGTARVLIVPKGGAPVLLFVDGMTAPVDLPSGQATLDTSFHISDPGTYQITFNDSAFPEALSSFNLAVLPPGASQAPLVTMAAPQNTAAFNAAVAGDYRLLVVAQAGASGTGLYGVKIVGGSAGTTVAYGQSQTIGKLPASTSITLPATGTYSLSLTDFAFPAALSNVRAVVVQGADVPAQLSAAGTVQFNANQGSAALYVIATAASPPGSGSYGVQLAQASQTVYSDVRAVQVEDTTNLNNGFVYHVTFPASGSYQLQSTDFAFPQAFNSMAAAVSQNGVVLAKLSAPGTINVQAAAGAADIVVAATLVTPTANGLFGVNLNQSGVTLFEITQGVGGLFRETRISVPAAGKYQVTLTDHKFPEQFGDLAMAVTRGSTLVGQIFGGGDFSFDATAGDYSLNLIARTKTTSRYGLYGSKVQDAPPVPVVTLTATRSTIAPQEKTTLNWSATNATNCTGSGGWTGNRAASGSEEVGPLAANATFTLNCTGPGGSGSASAAITVATQSKSGGGGGGLTGGLLIAIGLLASARSRFARRAWNN